MDCLALKSEFLIDFFSFHWNYIHRSYFSSISVLRQKSGFIHCHLFLSVSMITVSHREVFGIRRQIPQDESAWETDHWCTPPSPTSPSFRYQCPLFFRPNFARSSFSFESKAKLTTDSSACVGSLFREWFLPFFLFKELHERAIVSARGLFLLLYCVCIS